MPDLPAVVLAGMLMDALKGLHHRLSAPSDARGAFLRRADIGDSAAGTRLRLLGAAMHGSSA
jgi:hypothetical protein